ncbi:LOW QUALITY PROTEIN: kinetochore-associated protein DSN1 homolog [Stegastes partitus]|uniref:LOW QUALITY PROTEIN: kinetochore-associated protein DSN1 homolog n=2 Tax=Stegastes partitus TaxID=144197 RepID=A0A9Y4N0P4_9TELE|nr:PREDICTED: LOW QUALITY PROTEIN: kinetochore-associated protein DSN1 homolog [Stegastes partitus]
MVLSSVDWFGLLGARSEELFERKMAEKHLEDGKDSCGSVAESNDQNEVHSLKQTPKRRSSTSPGAAPPQKSPRTDCISPTTQTSDGDEGQSETEKKEMQTENTEDPAGPSVSPTARRKSWRRATITRRSLPALPNPYQALCRSISTSLSQQERLEKLMESSMKLAIERTQNLLQSMPNTSLETFQKQVKHIQKKWGCLAKSIHTEPDQLPPTEASKPAMQRAMEKVQRAINRLQDESESWEALLNKHRSKAEELERKVEHGQKTGVSLDSASVAQSSQYLVIQSKPDYHVVLCRQQPKLQTMGMIMDTQCKMVRELLSIKEQSQLLVKETSGRLAAEAGFQDLSSDLLRNLMAAPLSTATT